MSQSEPPLAGELPGLDERKALVFADIDVAAGDDAVRVVAWARTSLLAGAGAATGLSSGAGSAVTAAIAAVSVVGAGAGAIAAGDVVAGVVSAEACCVQPAAADRTIRMPIRWVTCVLLMAKRRGPRANCDGP